MSQKRVSAFRTPFPVSFFLLKIDLEPGNKSSVSWALSRVPSDRGELKYLHHDRPPCFASVPLDEIVKALTHLAIAIGT